MVSTEWILKGNEGEMYIHSTNKFFKSSHYKKDIRLILCLLS